MNILYHASPSYNRISIKIAGLLPRNGRLSIADGVKEPRIYLMESIERLIIMMRGTGPFHTSSTGEFYKSIDIYECQCLHNL